VRADIKGGFWGTQGYLVKKGWDSRWSRKEEWLSGCFLLSRKTRVT